jgi:heat-inducible transcriptional repressor
MPLDERKYKILRAIIDDYILTAMPVGSRTLAKQLDIGLSSATIRNEMSDLEEMGYLDQPHTSAGRVPSLQAFRLYVDQLMRIAAVGKEEREYIRHRVNKSSMTMDDILSNTAQVLSELTDYASAVMLPKARQLVFQHMQLVPVTPTSALAVIVTSAGVLKDTLIKTPEGTSPEMLQRISNALTHLLRGKTPRHIPAAIKRLREDLSEHARLAEEIVASIAEQAHRSEQREILLGGRTNLLKHPEYSNAEKILPVLSALEPKGSLASILSSKQSLQFQISIGPEIGASEMNDCSLVTVSYQIGDDFVGSMGIVGPVRMDYARVTSVLMHMQKTLNEMLKSEDH